ncbi:hypothetical protein LV457_02665 [Mycobacterium sp. MYCO198283]|nr:hypothetical protein [Mycobacterium sp. MYCO198283]MCG5431192.1 hypothetical protein [Mycobacterium sp. MYCO198283]
MTAAVIAAGLVMLAVGFCLGCVAVHHHTELEATCAQETRDTLCRRGR